MRIVVGPSLSRDSATWVVVTADESVATEDGQDCLSEVALANSGHLVPLWSSSVSSVLKRWASGFVQAVDCFGG